MKKSGYLISKTDEALLNKIFSLLKAKLESNPYDWNGKFAAEIRRLPKGLRAMAATHHLDVSLALDDIGWHFLNFGEEGHVQETEMGLRELGMNEMANLFSEAYRIMKPHLAELRQPGGDYFACLERADEMKRINELSERARALQQAGGIYLAWVNYARQTPGQVFGGQSPHE